MQKTIDSFIEFIKSQVLSISNYAPTEEIKDTIAGEIPNNSDSRCFCFKYKEKTFKIVIFDISEEKKI